MVRVRVELYKGPVNRIFQRLPGYTDRDLDENQFWAVVIPEPRQGTAEARWIASVPGDRQFPIDTLGTQPLPANTEVFNVSSVWIKAYKYNPYIYKVIPPGREALEPIPDPPPPPEYFPPFGYYCRSVVPPIPGIGIWIVGVLPHLAQKLPKAPPGREAVFEPADSIPSVQKDPRQPYLILSDDPRPQYVSYYSCIDWNSAVEVMNLQHWKAECVITVYGRPGNPVWEQSLLLEPHETKRIFLDEHVPRHEGLIVVEPLKHGWEFPSMLCISEERPYRRFLRFVPFIRVT